MLWILSEIYYPEDTSTGYYVTRIAEGLAEHTPVTVLCGQPTYAQRGMRAPKTEVRNRVRIIRCASTRFSKNGVLGRACNASTFCLSVIVAATRHIRPGDDVMALTNPPLLPPVALSVCRVRRARYTLLVHDVYPDVLVPAVVSRRRGAAYRVLDRIYASVYRRAHRVIVLGRDVAERLRDRVASPVNTLRVVPHWADLDEIRPDPDAGRAVRSEWGLSNAFVAQYCGNVGRTHAVDDLVEAAAQLDRRAPVLFSVIGDGAALQSMQRRAGELGLRNVRFSPRVPRERLCATLNACDLALITLKSGMQGVSVPSRLYNVMAAGKPVVAVAEPGTELACVVTEEQIGYVVSPTAPALLAQTLERARNDMGGLAGMGSRACAAAKSKYTFARTLAGFREALERPAARGTTAPSCSCSCS